MDSSLENEKFRVKQGVKSGDTVFQVSAKFLNPDRSDLYFMYILWYILGIFYFNISKISSVRMRPRIKSIPVRIFPLRKSILRTKIRTSKKRPSIISNMSWHWFWRIGQDAVRDAVKIMKNNVSTLVLNSGSRLDSRLEEDQDPSQDLNYEKI